MEKIRSFFKVESNYQLFVVNLVFAITGTSSLFVADYILDMLLITQENYDNFFYWITRIILILPCLLYTSPSPRDRQKSRMPSSA